MRLYKVIKCHLKCETKLPYSGIEFGGSKTEPGDSIGLILRVNNVEVGTCPARSNKWVDISDYILEQDNRIQIESRCFRLFSLPKNCIKANFELWMDHIFHICEEVTPEELPPEVESGKITSCYKDYLLPRDLLFD